AALSIAGSLAEDHADAQIVIIADGSIDRGQIPPTLTTPVRSVGVGVPDALNVAVGGLATRATDGRLSALARIINYGQQPTTGRVTLKVDGRSFDTRSLSIDAGA